MVRISEVQGERMAAEKVLAEMNQRRSFGRDELLELIESVDVADALRLGDRATKRELYENLSLSLSYDPAERVVHAHAGGWVGERVGGGT